MTEIRCDVTELIVSQCGCRKHRGARTVPTDDPFTSVKEFVPQIAGTAGPWFPASFEGTLCSCCGDEIEPGDLIRADGYGGWEMDHDG